MSRQGNGKGAVRAILSLFDYGESGCLHVGGSMAQAFRGNHRRSRRQRWLRTNGSVDQTQRGLRRTSRPRLQRRRDIREQLGAIKATCLLDIAERTCCHRHRRRNRENPERGKAEHDGHHRQQQDFM